uniref:ATP synthase subunit delta, chloroplastic n=1 Tax=Dasya naccarioides TaxID=2007180 RepID=A0A1Z1MGG7_9FLOR|nr:ATP synthase CF1 subunit delta [Dasya naccarioides]ARW65170.1 ATP synthase CF1 subunit delta [Dasya naccarioides]
MMNQSTAEKISVPYAEALLDLAKNINVLSETEQDLSFISTTLSNSKDLQLLLANPLISAAVKKKVLFELFNDKINKFILNFLSILVDRRRIVLLNVIINKYLQLAYELKSVVVADLLTAVEFNELQQEAIVKKIKLITNSDNVKLVINTDSNLIGGFIVKIGSKIIDASLSGKLSQIALYLNTN